MPNSLPFDARAAAAALVLSSLATAQCPNPLVAWGRNDDGQCNVPVALGLVESFAAGETWSVAFARGRFATWGSTPTGVPPPQDATLGGGVPRLFAGDRFTVALNPQNGRVACWGSNIYGECDIPSGLPPIKAVAAGPQRVLAIESATGLVRAWGRNSDGEGSVPKDLGACRAVAAGNRHSVAVTADGTLRCWGDNFRGACDLPAETTGYLHVSSLNFHSLGQRGDLGIRAWGWNDDGQCSIPAGLPEVRDGGIAAGTRHSAAIVFDGGSGGWTVRCWGSNASGACDVPPGLTDVVAIAASYDRTMALRANGRVVAWGRNEVGQGTVPSEAAENPELVSGGYDFTIAASGSPPYTVFGWGSNEDGQRDLPQPATGLRYTQLSAGWSHSVGLLSDGTVRCAGGVYSGQCGNMPALGGIRQVAASNFFTLAVGHDDVIHAWEQIVGGWSAGFWNGNLARTVAVGNETQAMVTTDGSFYCVGAWYPFTSSPCEDTISGDYGDIVQLAVGAGHVLALRSDGSLYAWTTLTDDPNLQIPSGMGPVASIAAGERHSVALTRTGKVYCWGFNQYGQRDVPADIGKVKAISAGRYHTVAIRDFSTTLDGDGSFLDDCPYGRGDLNADGRIDAEDLVILVGLWGATGAEIGDLTGDGTIDGVDLSKLLAAWSPAPAK